VLVDKLPDVHDVKGLLFDDEFASAWIRVDQSAPGVPPRNDGGGRNEQFHAVLAGNLSNLGHREVAGHERHVLVLH